jgi:hypothetical protein
MPATAAQILIKACCFCDQRAYKLCSAPKNPLLKPMTYCNAKITAQTLGHRKPQVGFCGSMAIHGF